MIKWPYSSDHILPKSIARTGGTAVLTNQKTPQLAGFGKRRPSERDDPFVFSQMSKFNFNWHSRHLQGVQVTDGTRHVGRKNWHSANLCTDWWWSISQTQILRYSTSTSPVLRNEKFPSNRRTMRKEQEKASGRSIWWTGAPNVCNFRLSTRKVFAQHTSGVKVCLARM